MKNSLIVTVLFTSIFFFNNVFSNSFIKISEIDKKPVLEIAIRTYEKNGNTIHLVPVIHLASETFYNHINELMKDKTVIYELAGGTFEDKERLERAIQELGNDYPEIYKMIKLVTTPAQLVALKYGFAYQMDSLNFSKASKLIHADIKGDTLMSLIQKPEELKDMIAFYIEQVVRPDILKKHSNVIDALKEEVNNQLKSEESLINMFKRNLKKETIQSMQRITKVFERNKIVEQELVEFLKKNESPNDIVIIYGVDHMPDLESFIKENLGFKVKNENWVEVLDLIKKPVITNL